ncbi:MAG: permease [Fibrobacteres bacterium]|nr:permease [Fibrobacterota bacterium]
MNILKLSIESIFYFYLTIAPYLILGLLVAGLLHIFFPDTLIKRHLGHGNILPVIKATLFGMPLPLCSCGVVPVAVSLNKRGANAGATAAFMTATPQIGADSFLITYSLLGPVFAVFRIAASLITALFSGILINLTERKEQAVQTPTVNTKTETETTAIRLKKLPQYIQFEVLGPIAFTLITGIIIAGVLSAVIPESLFTRHLSNPWISMVIMMLIGIPLYVCASASTPIAASLVLKGMAPGAALVFLLTGPATNAVTIAAVAKSLGKRAVAVYLFSIASVSLLMGHLLNVYAGTTILNITAGSHEMEIPAWLTNGSAVLLGLMLLFHFVKPHLFKSKQEGNMNTDNNRITMRVDGMTCAHCAASVKKAVESVAETKDAVVDLKGKSVTFTLLNTSNREKVKEAVKEAGFEC